MAPDKIDLILRNLHEGLTCHLGDDEEESYSIVTIRRSKDGTYRYNTSIGARYEITVPVESFEKLVATDEDLRQMLANHPGDSETRISFADENPFGGANKEKLVTLRGYLARREVTVYVVMKVDTYKKQTTGKEHYEFNCVFSRPDQAEGMLEYLRTRQNSQCHVKEVQLRLKGEDVVTDMDVAANETLTNLQIVVSILGMDLKMFFEG